MTSGRRCASLVEKRFQGLKSGREVGLLLIATRGRSGLGQVGGGWEGGTARGGVVDHRGRVRDCGHQPLGASEVQAEGQR